MVGSDLKITFVDTGAGLTVWGYLTVVILNIWSRLWGLSESVGFAVPVERFALMGEGDIVAVDPRDLDRKSIWGYFAVNFEGEG